MESVAQSDGSITPLAGCTLLLMRHCVWAARLSVPCATLIPLPLAPALVQFAMPCHPSFAPASLMGSFKRLLEGCAG